MVTVKLGTGTLPHASAQAAAPNASTRASASGADSVSFQSLAGRRTAPASSSTTSPCCWPPTAMAAGRCRSGTPASAQAASNAAHQAAGSCSLRGGVVGGWGARPWASRVPLPASRTWTLQAEVDESTPTTTGIARRP